MIETIAQTGGITTTPATGALANTSRGEGAGVASSSTQQIQKEVQELQDSKDVEDLKKELMQLTEELNREFNPLNMNIKFGFSDDIDSLYVTVSERDSNRLIRKIPSDEAIELMVKMREIVGIIFDKKG
ncbi:FlaG family protein [Wolinella succinogenes]|uniref:FlaG family protein n=1 Tax=Wolinella succinogenes TaxID=844 RepID=UPI00240A829E|nr:FlaG family protein [Wolinella succinogenes]